MPWPRRGGVGAVRGPPRLRRSVLEVESGRAAHQVPGVAGLVADVVDEHPAVQRAQLRADMNAGNTHC